jgi:hypothetical protein
MPACHGRGLPAQAGVKLWIDRSMGGQPEAKARSIAALMAA